MFNALNDAICNRKGSVYKKITPSQSNIYEQK